MAPSKREKPRRETGEALPRLDVADEEIVLPAERDPPERALGRVVVERHRGVGEKHAELVPLTERIPNRGAQRRDLEGPSIGVGRTFLGFDERRAFSCFVSCAAERGAPSPLGGEGAVSGARLVGSLPPPPPGIALRAVTWGVHDPRPTAAAGGLLVVAAGVVAVVARRKPRSA